MEAFGVGIHDRYFIPRNVDFPFPIGIEGAGKIVQLGNQVTDFAVGDRVIFTTSFQPKGGSWAEYAAANQATLIPMPDHLTFQQGAAVHVAGKQHWKACVPSTSTKVTVCLSPAHPERLVLLSSSWQQPKAFM